MKKPLTPFGTKWHSPVKDVLSPLTHPPSSPIPDHNPQVTSLNTSGGCALLKPKPVYTGSNMLGIGTMHKSNAVPVFSQEQAQDIATMRRG